MIKKIKFKLNKTYISDLYKFNFLSLPYKANTGLRIGGIFWIILSISIFLSIILSKVIIATLSTASWQMFTDFQNSPQINWQTLNIFVNNTIKFFIYILSFCLLFLVSSLSFKSKYLSRKRELILGQEIELIIDKKRILLNSKYSKNILIKSEISNIVETETLIVIESKRFGKIAIPKYALEHRDINALLNFK